MWLWAFGGAYSDVSSAGLVLLLWLRFVYDLAMAVVNGMD